MRQPWHPMAKPVSDDVRFRVLRVLQDSPDLSQRQIAGEVGVSVGAVNYCLHALVEKGQIKVHNFQCSNNKLRYAYILTPHGVAEKMRLTGAFLKRKVAEYDALKAEIASLEAEFAPLQGGEIGS
jgi:EPS-associated MarR family transcriptional regulator